MPWPMRLSVPLCLFLLATCSARPNWHKGYLKQNDISKPPVEAVNQKKHESFENVNPNGQGKIRLSRQAPNQFFFNSRYTIGGASNFNNPHGQFQFSNQANLQPFDRQQFQQPGPHAIGQLASTLQNIIGSHLEATVQLNKAVQFGTLNNGFPQPPGFRPLQPPICPSCTHHHSQSYHEMSHHFEIGQPQIIPGTQTHQFEIDCPQGGTGCRETPQINPDPIKPFPSNPEKEIPDTGPQTERTITTTEQQDFGGGEESDIVYGNDDKDPKTLDSEDNTGIVIRFGEGDSGDVLLSKN